MSNLLVTGADGFVGANFVKYLLDEVIKEDEEVFALRRRHKPDLMSPLALSGVDQEAVNVYSDIRDFEEIKKIVLTNEISKIYHFAAQPIVKLAQADPAITFNTNIIGTLNIMEAARISGIRNVFIMSTDKVYGDGPAPYKEGNSICGDMGVYDASKASAEVLARAYKTYGIAVSVARPCNIYGPFDLNFSRVIPGVIKEILTTGKYKVFMPSNLHQLREFIYVEDLCRIIEAISETGDTYNVGSNEITQISELKDKIASTLGFGERVEVEDTRKFREIVEQYMDDSRVRSELECSDRIPLDAGLEATASWYVEYIKYRWRID